MKTEREREGNLCRVVKCQHGGEARSISVETDKSEKPQRHKAEEEMRRRETKEVERGEEGKQRNE